MRGHLAVDLRHHNVLRRRAAPLRGVNGACSRLGYGFMIRSMLVNMQIGCQERRRQTNDNFGVLVVRTNSWLRPRKSLHGNQAVLVSQPGVVWSLRLVLDARSADHVLGIFLIPQFARLLLLQLLELILGPRPLIIRRILIVILGCENGSGLVRRGASRSIVPGLT